MTKKQAGYGIGLLVCVVATAVWFLLPEDSQTTEDPNLTYGDFNTIEVVSAPSPDHTERPSLETFTQTNLSLSYERVAEEFRVDEYRLYRCPVAGEDDLVLTLTAISRPDGDGYTIAAARAAVRAWEPSMYEDLGAILYNDLERAESVVLPDFTGVPETDLRFSTTTVAGNERAIFYDWHYNILLVGTSANCVQQGKRRLQGA